LPVWRTGTKKSADATDIRARRSIDGVTKRDEYVEAEIERDEEGDKIVEDAEGSTV